MGEAKKPALRMEFDRKVKLEFHGAKITSDAGLLACRELDEVLGLMETASEHLEDCRTGKSTQHSLLGMFRQSVYGRLAGYEKEGKNAVKWTKLSCKNFRDNQVRLQLFALAYNMGSFLRTLVLPRSAKHWTLTTIREKLIKIGAKMVTTARYVYFQMAEVAVSRELFASILSRINALRPLAVT